jgi:hypothetical protein
MIAPPKEWKSNSSLLGTFNQQVGPPTGFLAGCRFEDF